MAEGVDAEVEDEAGKAGFGILGLDLVVGSSAGMEKNLVEKESGVETEEEAEEVVAAVGRQDKLEGVGIGKIGNCRY